jgi:hypothetical protein
VAVQYTRYISVKFNPFGWRVLRALHFDVLNWSRRPIHVSSLSVRITLPTTESLEKGMEMCREKIYLCKDPALCSAAYNVRCHRIIQCSLKSAARRWASECNYRSRGNVVGAVKGLWNGRSGVRIPAGVKEIYLFSETYWRLWCQPVLFIIRYR